MTGRPLVSLSRCASIAALSLGVAAVLTLTHTRRSQAAAAVGSSATAEQCRLIETSVDSARLRDSRALYVNPQAAVVANGQLLLLGRPTFAWTPHPSPDDRIPARDRALGALVDRRGIARLVPQPLPGVEARYPRTTPDSAGGWHVVFARVLGDTNASRAIADSAELWYGHYDGEHWREVRIVTTVRDAAIDSDLGSTFVRVADGVAFAFTFDRGGTTGSNRPGNQGVVLAHGRPGRWKLDTLRTRLGPNSVQLVRAGRSGLRAFVMQPWFDDQLRPRASALFVAAFDSVWHEPTMVAADSVSPLLGNLAVTSFGHAIASWRTSATSSVVERAVLGDGEISSMPLERRAVLTNSPTWDVAPLDAGTELWVGIRTPGKPARLVLVRDGHLTTFDDTRAPNAIGNARVLRLTGTTALIVGTTLASAPDEPPARTILTTVRVACDRS